MSLMQEHILLLGATGASGLAFIEAVLERPPPQIPSLTLYVRPGSRSKLPEKATATATGKPGNRIRVVEGDLDDVQALTSALSASDTDPTMFPPVSTVVSLLGAYLSLEAVFTRDQSHPIADAITQFVLPTLKTCHVCPRILVLSTPTAFCHPAENKAMPWKWWFYTMIPILFAPQGNAEMRGIAQAVVNDEALPWTIFRVPHLTDGDPLAKVVVAGNLDHAFEGSTDLSRGSLVRWLLKEIEQKNWIRQAPLLGNA